MEWNQRIKAEFEMTYFSPLAAFLKEAYANQTVYPPKEQLFNAFAYATYADLKVVILGQDPYHQPHQAHGLCFSVNPGIPFPPSLQNIFTELVDDVGCAMPASGCLIPWAKQGVLLLNTVLSVTHGQPLSHQNHGWEIFTDHILQACNDHPQPVVFILWGRPAQSKAVWITNSHHLILRAPHPSPLSAYRGFFGSRPFSTTNTFLIHNGRTPISWCL